MTERMNEFYHQDRINKVQNAWEKSYKRVVMHLNSYLSEETNGKNIKMTFNIEKKRKVLILYYQMKNKYKLKAPLI